MPAVCLSQACRDSGSRTPPDSYVIFVGSTTQGSVLRPLEFTLDVNSQGTLGRIVPTLRELLGRVSRIPQPLHYPIQLYPRVILLDLQEEDWVEGQVVEALVIED